jgi:hypothetical protein
VVERHDGGGGSRFGRDRLGSDEGGDDAPVISGAEGGGAPRGGARAREAAVAASAGRPGEEDDRVRQAGWAGQRPRPSGGWRW